MKTCLRLCEFGLLLRNLSYIDAAVLTSSDHSFDVTHRTPLTDGSNIRLMPAIVDVNLRLKLFLDLFKMEDIINSYITRPFYKRMVKGKRILIPQRPTPPLPDLVFPGPKYTRHFNCSLYDSHTWLAGSIDFNALFCWPCVLFSTETSPWTRTGFTQLSNLSNAMSRHEKSYGHKFAVIKFVKFETQQYNKSVINNLKQSVILRNEKVKQNRGLLKRMINAVCSFTHQDPALRGLDESDNPNRGICLESLDLTSEYNAALSYRLQSSTVFKEASISFEDDLKAAVAGYLSEEIKKEINAADFVSFFAAETTVRSGQAQFALVARYCKSGSVFERFVTFVSSGIEEKHMVANAILKEIEKLGCQEKLVSQSYDEAALMTSQINHIQEVVKLKYGRHILLLHCHAHVLNSALARCVSEIPDCKLFFSSLQGIASFFSGSVERAKFYEAFVQRHRLNPVRFYNSSRLVNTVFTHKRELREMFDKMLEHQDEVDPGLLSLVQGYISLLNDFGFCFLLSVFNAIFVHTAQLETILGNVNSTVKIHHKKCAIKLLRTEQELKKLYSSVDIGEPAQCVESAFREIYGRIIDGILNQLEVRLQDSKELLFLSLLNPEKFSDYRKFPEEAIKCLIRNCSSFDSVALKNELILVYNDPDFRGKNPYELNRYLWDSNLHVILPEVSKLANLCCTIPATPVGGERSSSSLDRLRSFCETGRPRLTGLAVLAVEREFLKEAKLRNEEKFYDDVTQLFAQGDHKMDFSYQQ